MAQSAPREENKMGTMPVNKLLLSMGIPMMISMLVQAMYNVVDSVFVSRICEDALTGVSLAFPAQNFMIALASGTGVGMNALLSRSLGAKEQQTANKAAVHGLFLALCSYLVFLIFGLFGVRAFMMSQTNDPEIVNYGTTYLSIICIVSFGMFFEMTLERILQGTGRTFYTMITQTTGAVINIILDPILIFGLLGAPELGIAGAAIATVFGQVVAGLMALMFNAKKNPDITISFKGFKPNLKIIKTIYAVGLPSILMISISSIMTYGMNLILIAFSSTATAVFGAYYKLQSFIFMPVFGLNNSMVPIIAYNYGARRPERIIKTVKLSVMYAVCIMLIGLLLFQTQPTMLLKFFAASDEMLAIGIPALRTISLSFLIAGFCVIGSSTQQAMGHGMFSMLISFARQLVVLLPVAFLLSKTGNLDLVWFSFPIAELASMIVTAGFLLVTYRRDIKPMYSETDE